MTDEETKIWKQGYDAGIEECLKQNGTAVQIGRAIIEALDNRYEPIKEDY